MSNKNNNSLSTKSRNICGITYAPLYVVENALNFNFNFIKSYAYILHDKDEGKESHIHFIIRLYRPLSLRTVKRWFWCLNDDESSEVNTHPQTCSDVLSYYEYLYHKNHPDKYQYKECSVVCSNRDDFIFADSCIDDTLQECYNAILNGSTPHELVQRYGRDFLIHANQIRQLIEWDQEIKMKKYLKGS